MTADVTRRAGAEFVGTAFLVMAVVGSGIAAQRLSPGDRGLELLENAIATGAALVAIIVAVGPVSGAHLNPAVSALDAARGGLDRGGLAIYVVAQLAGSAVGAVAANLMFALPAVTIAAHQRSGAGLALGEGIATFGLLVVITGVAASRRTALAPFAVGAYIAAAYFFTSSTSFANPAVTVGRVLSNTFAGISPSSVAPFVGAQAAGTVAAWLVARWWYPRAPQGDAVVVPHGEAQASLR